MQNTKTLYRLLLATRSNSSFFLMAYELLLPFAALINSSAKHSATDLTFRKAASRAPIVRRAMAWLTRRSGETSTACRRTTPPDPIRVESSRQPLFITAFTSTCQKHLSSQQKQKTVACSTHLDGVRIGCQVYDFQCVLHNANGHQLLAVVAPCRR